MNRKTLLFQFSPCDSNMDVFSNRVFLRMLWELIVFNTLFTIPVSVSASIWDSDPFRSFEDLSDPELAFSSDKVVLTPDQTASLFDSALSDGDSDAFLENTPDPLFSNTDKSGLTALNFEPTNDPSASDFFNVVDCSTSTPFPTIGKSRIRRTETPESCKNPASGADIPPLGGGKEEANPTGIDFDKLMEDSEVRRRLMQAESNSDQNPYCYLLTGGLLPWGVCDSGNRDDLVGTGENMIFPGYGRFVLHKLTRCTAGT